MLLAAPLQELPGLGQAFALISANLHSILQECIHHQRPLHTWGR